MVHPQDHLRLRTPLPATYADPARITVRVSSAVETSCEPSSNASLTLNTTTVERILNADSLLPRYRVQEVLGSGLSGMVYGIWDQFMHRQIAVKVMQSNSSARALREVHVAGALEHPNILPFYDAGQADDGVLWLAMRKAPGQDLLHIMEDPARRADLLSSDRDAVAIVLPIANALAYAHMRGILHHDVKPSNIVIDLHGDVMLVDWGSATTIAERSGGMRPQEGTLPYIAPEQLVGAECDVRSDIYALGATLFHLVYGRPPMVPGQPRSGAGQLLRRAEPNRSERSQTTRAVQAIINKAIALEPAQRYATMHEFAQDCRAYLTDRPMNAYRLPLIVRVLRWLRFHRLAAVAALVALLGMATSVLLWQHHRSQTTPTWIQTLDLEESLRAESNQWSVLVAPDWLDVNTQSIPYDQAVSWGIVEPNADKISINADDRLYGPAMLRWQQSFARNVRFSYTVTPLVKPNNCNIILGLDRAEGLILHFGGFNEYEYLTITRGSYGRGIMKKRLPAPIQVGQPLAIEIQRLYNRLSVRVGGQVIIDGLSLDQFDIAAPTYLAFDTNANRISISNLQVEELAQPPLISHMAMAEELLRAGQTQRARQQFLWAQDRGQADPAHLAWRIGASYHDEGLEQQARSVWRQALEAGHGDLQWRELIQLAICRSDVARGDHQAAQLIIPVLLQQNSSQNIREEALDILCGLLSQPVIPDEVGLTPQVAYDYSLNHYRQQLQLIRKWVIELNLDLHANQLELAPPRFRWLVHCIVSNCHWIHLRKEVLTSNKSLVDVALSRETNVNGDNGKVRTTMPVNFFDYRRRWRDVAVKSGIINIYHIELFTSHAWNAIAAELAGDSQAHGQHMSSILSAPPRLGMLADYFALGTAWTLDLRSPESARDRLRLLARVEPARTQQTIAYIMGDSSAISAELLGTLGLPLWVIEGLRAELRGDNQQAIEMYRQALATEPLQTKDLDEEARDWQSYAQWRMRRSASRDIKVMTAP